jgi:parvulin-like peptidyl-prolyl isomerase
MKRGLRWIALIGVALFVGAATGELLFRSPGFRDLAGRWGGRGHLVSVVNGKGIYEADLGGEEELSAAEAIAAENLRRISATEPIEPIRVDREVALLKAQFGDEKKFAAARRSAGLSDSSLREKIEMQLRGLNWLEKQMTGANVAEQECRNFYDAHRDLFGQLTRYRAAHLFLAAHAETLPEVVAEKEKAITAFAARLAKGETLSQLASEASEDEASKPRGGDLGWFCETRMPSEFIAEIQKLRVGETSKPFRSHLGFHIAQLTETRAFRFLTFEEARPEISTLIANERRAIIVNRVASR